MTHKQLLHRFLRRETMACALYRTHARLVPVGQRPLLLRLEAVEKIHLQRFAERYQETIGRPAPSCFMDDWVGIGLIYLNSIFGDKALLRFECWAEKKAVTEYTEALAWIHDPSLKALVRQTLDEEQEHGLVQDLATFKHDEESHIQEMQDVLKKMP